MTTPTPANLYTQGYGSRPENVEIPVYSTRAPLVSDVKYPLGKRWINSSANTEYTLTSFQSTQGILAATWTLLTSSVVAAAVKSVTGDNAATSFPDVNGNINIFGGLGISTFSFPSSNEVSISSLNFSSNWNQLSANATLFANQSYMCIGGGTLQLFLPVFSSFGDMIEVCLDGSSGFSILQTSSQQIRVANQTTTLGGSGSLSSTRQGDGFIAVCKVANTLWTITTVVGNLTIV